MENQNNNNSYRLCPRRLYQTYLLTGIVALILLIIGIFFPIKGITIFEIGTVSLIISKGFIVILCLLGILITGIFTLYQKKRSDTFIINLSENSVDFTFGVISRKTEDVEMHSIHDVIYRQGPWDLFFKTADIIIYSHDFTTPIIKFDGLNIEDAHKIHNYIGQYASDSLVKYYNKTGTTASTPQTIQPPSENPIPPPIETPLT